MEQTTQESCDFSRGRFNLGLLFTVAGIGFLVIGRLTRLKILLHVLANRSRNDE